MAGVNDRLRQIFEERTQACARWLMRDLANPTHLWHGETGPCPRSLHLLRLGDCSWQVIEHGHAYGDPGYPALLDQRLRDEGIALRFQDCYVGKAADIDPATLSRVSRATPDVIIVHMGAMHAALELLPLYRCNVSVARLCVNRRLGRVGGWLHRGLTAPLLRAFGRPMLDACTPEQATQGFTRLAAWIETNCPGTPWVILPPHPAVRCGWTDPAIIDATTQLYADAAVAAGGTFLDYRARLAQLVAERGTETVYGATGYDLMWPGHAVIEQMLSDWIDRIGLVDREDPRRVAALAA